MPYLIIFIVLAVLLVLMIQFWYVTVPVIAIVALSVTLPRVIREARKRRYFASDEFVAHKSALESVVAEHNAIAGYVAELRQGERFTVAGSSTGSHAHLAAFENTSRHRYQRDRNVASYADRSVHNCSLQVVRNAASDPLKYLMKYFDIPASESSLESVEALGENVSRLEDAVANLGAREKAISASINPPSFILKYFADEFMAHVGVELSPVSVPYPEYVFEYVSAGGNSSQRTTVKLDIVTIDALVTLISGKIRLRATAAGQRALMTAKLRSWIKDRDGHTCKMCAISVAREPNLLLEVDHIMPISKGGLSVVENLQTLCWRCNRSKSSKVLAS